MPDLHESMCSCKLFTCCRSAQRGSLPREDAGFRVLVWWWFENSRACLYYFFIVNDCQFIPRLAACVVVGYPGGFDEG
ncbi:hypothetical protein F8275_02410 [Bifidobacterium breve]|nr:hypothetical protein F8275_02410 [Bifidobacterium breve]